MEGGGEEKNRLRKEKHKVELNKVCEIFEG